MAAPAPIPMEPVEIEPAETDLAARARGGDRQAISNLYELHAAALLRHARRMLGDDAAARDAVQESFAKAIAALGRTAPGLRFKPWIYRILTNVCLRELRRRKRCEPREGVGERPAGDATNPELARRRRELGPLVERALARMPARYRQLLLLRELEHLRYDELALALGLRESGVKVTLHRARARFAALFIAEQLLVDQNVSLQCAQLRSLVDASRRRPLERHLETCPRCRTAERKPAAELFALLPPLPPLTAPPLPSPVANAAPLLGGGTTIGMLALGGTLAVTVAAIVLPAEPVGGMTPKAPVTTVSTATRGTPPRPLLGPSPATGPTAAVAPAPTLAPRARPTSRERATVKPVASRPAASKPAAPARHAAAGPLEAKLRFRPGTVTVTRAGQRFGLRRKQSLALGDRVRTRPGTSLGLLLPGQQWLALSGAAELVALPLTDRASTAVRVTLLAGELRLRASARGHGVSVRYGRHTCAVDEGEVRLRQSGERLRVETLEGQAQLSGPHASRTVAAGSGVWLGPNVGFAGALLGAPTRLSPTRQRAFSPPALRWDAVATASGYRVLVGRDPDFLLTEEVAVVDRASYTPRVTADGKHFWKVIALRDGTQGHASKIYSFDLVP